MLLDLRLSRFNSVFQLLLLNVIPPLMFVSHKLPLLLTFCNWNVAGLCVFSLRMRATYLAHLIHNMTNKTNVISLISYCLQYKFDGILRDQVDVKTITHEFQNYKVFIPNVGKTVNRIFVSRNWIWICYQHRFYLKIMLRVATIDLCSNFVINTF